MEKKHKLEPQTGLSPDTEVVFTVTGLASDGRGLGRLESGMVVFAPDALPGQHVRVVLDTVRSRMAEGRICEVLTPAPQERVAPCPHAEDCGGCPWQKLPYTLQLEWKQRLFYDALRRIGKLEVTEQPIIPSPLEWGYRNKMSFAFAVENGNLVLGQRARRSHSVVDLHHCLLQDKLTMRVLAAVRTVVAASGHALETWRHAIIRRPQGGNGTNELGLEIAVNPACASPAGNTLYLALRAAIPELTLFALTRRSGDVETGDAQLFTAGTPLTETLHRPDGSALHLQFDHTSFLQVNTPATERLYAEALTLLQPQGSERLWDVYGGVGSIGLFMAPWVEELCGIDCVPGAVAMARANVEAAGMSGKTRYEVGNAALLGSRKKRVALFGQSPRPSSDLVIVDPPRAGLDKATIDGLLGMKPQKILYISCDPATLARDAVHLKTQYRLAHARPVDLFPQTPHVEGITLWEREGNAD